MVPVPSSKDRPLRVLIAKAGLDGHDRGARVVARALRDDGMEVIYTGRHVVVESVAMTALQEDVDVIGLSILSGAHLPLCRALLRELERLGTRGDVKVLVGGTIATRAQRDALLELGMDDVIPGGTPLQDVVDRVRVLGMQARGRFEAPMASGE